MRECRSLTAVLDDPNFASRAGLAPVLGLAERAGLRRLVGEHVRLGKPGWVNTRLKVPALVAGVEQCHEDGGPAGFPGGAAGVRGLQHRPDPGDQPGFAELTRSRLSYVDQNYRRGDTIAAANAALIHAQSRVPIAHGSVLAGTDLRTRPDSNCLSAVGPGGASPGLMEHRCGCRR